jgi:hypothetical protein
MKLTRSISPLSFQTRHVHQQSNRVPEQRRHHPSLRAIIKPLALIALVAGAPMAQAGFTTLTLPALNYDIQTIPSTGTAYSTLFPSPPGTPGTQTTTFNGVPFSLSVDGNGNNIFLTPAAPPTGGSGSAILNIPVGVFGVTQAYTMINSGFGVFGENNGFIEFIGTNSSYYKVDLIQGTNIRDHFNGVFNNVINGVNAVSAFVSGNARLDEQIYTLPQVFANETLITISFNGVDQGNAFGRPFIAAATVETGNGTPVPEPSVLALAALGLLATGAARRRS